jgi:hypothetical protein
MIRLNSTTPLARGRVPKVGFEPTRAYAHYALNVARLPIPPLRHAYFNGRELFYRKSQICQPFYLSV